LQELLISFESVVGTGWPSIWIRWTVPWSNTANQYFCSILLIESSTLERPKDAGVPMTSAEMSNNTLPRLHSLDPSSAMTKLGRLRSGDSPLAYSIHPDA
jgi:hypothetical protein